jgi:HK97 family phage prohead protease
MSTTTSAKPHLPTVGGLEIRHLGTSMECRTAGDKITFRGVASSTDSPYDMPWGTETIKRGAFDRTLAKGPDVMLTVNHQGLPIARTTNGSLRLFDVGRGLEFEATASASDPDAARVAAKVKAGLMGECSFGFRVDSQDWSVDRAERTITAIDLHRGTVDLVNYGANPNTSVTARGRRRTGQTPLSLYQSRALALSLRQDPRSRHVLIMNEAGRRRR